MTPHTNLEAASVVTYCGTGITLLFCHLHLSDLAIIVSTGATLIGVGCQIWVAITKVRLMKRSERWKSGDK